MLSRHYGFQKTASSHVPKKNNVLRRFVCIHRALLQGPRAQKNRLIGRPGGLALVDLSIKSGGALVQMHNLASLAAVEVVGPPLQQLGAFIHVGAAVVGGTHLIALLVG